MKTIQQFALTLAIAITGTVGFTSCSSDENVADNPNYNPQDNTVKTQLAISLASNAGTTTRMANTIVQGQETPVFRGMQDIRLIAFSKWVAKSEVDGDASGNIKAFNDKVFNLGSMELFDKTEQNAKVYNDLSVPVGTKAFLFYGRAKREDAAYPTGATDVEKSHLDKFHTGAMYAPSDYTVAVKDFEFSLRPIQPNVYEVSNNGVITQVGVNERATTLVSYIKNIREVPVTNVTLHSYLAAFQPTAGSSASIEAAVQDLWDKVNEVLTTTSTQTEKDEVAAIGAAITYQEDLGGACATIDENGKVKFVMQKIMGYPSNIFLPDGAAAIDWEDVNNPRPIVAGHNGTVYVAPLSSYVYPAELAYRANTTIGVSDVDNVSETYASASWSDISTGNSFYTWDGEVKGSTRSIALKNQVEYAVGRLDLQVKAKASTLYDAQGNAVNVPADGFPISAVLIGHQRNVNFQFGPITSSPVYTIYDREMTEPMAAKAGEAQGTNKTLVLESGGDVKQVNVCVEFTNTSGSSFVSKHGIVPAGGKFYLVGQLDLTKEGEIAGSSDMIFKQDYVTNAAFTIAQGTLGSTDNSSGLAVAYNVIPDLKTPQLEVAFSVDLEWKAGITFTKEF